MNLGYGLAALDSYYKEGDARQLRERADQRFDWEKQKAQSELSLLADKAAADRSGYQNTVDANAAAAQIRPGATANAITQQGIDATSLSGAKARQPGLEMAKDSEARTTLGAAKVKEAMQGVEVERIPSVVANARAKGVIDDATSSNLISATIADMIDSGNTTSLVSLLNAQKQAVNDPKIAALPDVASVARARDANGTDMLVLKDAAGNQIMAKPISTYQAARDSLKKMEIKDVKDGHSLVSVKGNTVTPLYTAPESASTRATKMGPLERDVEYLVNGHGMSKEQALSHLQSAKTMSRDNFVLKAIENSQAMGKKVTDADIASFGAMYDRASQSKGQPAGQAAPTAAGAPNPKIQRLIAPATQGPALSQAPSTAPAATAPAAAPAPQQPPAGPAPLSQRLAQAVQSDNQSGSRANFSRLADEVSKTAPQMQQQLSSLRNALPNAAGSQRAFVEQKIGELERELTLAQGIINQAKAQRGY